MSYIVSRAPKIERVNLGLDKGLERVRDPRSTSSLFDRAGENVPASPTISASASHGAKKRFYEPCSGQTFSLPELPTSRCSASRVELFKKLKRSASSWNPQEAVDQAVCIEEIPSECAGPVVHRRASTSRGTRSIDCGECAIRSAFEPVTGVACVKVLPCRCVLRVDAKRSRAYAESGILRIAERSCRCPRRNG